MERRVMGNYHARCGAGEKPEVETSEAYLSLLGEIPDFPGKISTMRKYNISVAIILQDKSQIEAMYKDKWKTITANCDSWLFLGSNEPETLKYMEGKLGYQTITTKSRNRSAGKGHSSQGFQQVKREVMTAEEIGRLPVDECIAFTGSGRGKEGIRPVRDKKYIYNQHPLFKETADGDGETFKYAEISYFDVWKSAEKNESILEAEISAIEFSQQIEAVPDEDLSIEDANERFDLINYEESVELKQDLFSRAISELSSELQSFPPGTPVVHLIGQVKSFPPKYLEELSFWVSNELMIPSIIIFANNPSLYIYGSGKGVSAYEDKIASFFAGKKDFEYYKKNELYSFKIKRDDFAEFKTLFAE